MFCPLVPFDQDISKMSPTDLRAHADALVRHGPPKYRTDDEGSGDEQLWQREVGNTMPVLAMAYVLTGDKQYLASARQ